mmetsp:Transcript_59227/g.105228  ORF Transcript_59227/g.105228 Transcript_59227/m.105228 type:complete len:128 (-) Transcript_59227:53-436(-)|eukprot:CAMPEP_0197649160 /NCGR_PEP_ID=MMETSP1338-20131121/28186_1 /TAXON_ID=43686 ORGANISM="Pelagodinium beii, Strain RCC1491" /NCGR_SAMPLE_ID=MMETSP1338 /ASSEMBLY_ACC=CAM_ASM_000754 /LENGTH=127 /DNA_ID=CAMNT_0043223279 /DNA_START=59 /DNA_END=442 /DNA_ORIENTATION=-
MPSKTGGVKPDTGKDSKKGAVQQKDEDGEFLQAAGFQQNMRTLSHCRIFAGVMAGCMAGILKFEGLSGVFMFILVTLLHSLMIFVKMGGEATRHFPKSKDLFVSQFGGGLLSFILFWTLAYDMVHIF